MNERFKSLWRRLFRGMNVHLVKLTVIAGVFVLILFSVLAYRFANEQPIWDWGIQVVATLIGTGLGVAGGIWLTGKAKQNDLLVALAGELQSCLGTLQRSPTSISGPDGKEIARARLGPLPFLVAEEAVRSAVFDADDTLVLTTLIAELKAHNQEVFFILATRVGLTQQHTLHHMLTDVKKRQEVIVKGSRELLESLESQGIKLPNSPDSQDAKEEARTESP